MPVRSRTAGTWRRRILTRDAGTSHERVVQLDGNPLHARTLENVVMITGNDAQIDASQRKPAPSQVGLGRAEQRTSPRANQRHTTRVKTCLVRLVCPKGTRHSFPDLRGKCVDIHSLFQLGHRRPASQAPDQRRAVRRSRLPDRFSSAMGEASRASSRIQKGRLPRMAISVRTDRRKLRSTIRDLGRVSRIASRSTRAPCCTS